MASENNNNHTNTRGQNLGHDNHGHNIHQQIGNGIQVGGVNDIQGVPVWQPDEEAKECYLCHSEFTFFNRKHHCRKCGKVTCADCSSIFTKYLPSTYVVSPPSQIFLESPHVPHRTCKSCAEELDMLRRALTEESESRGGVVSPESAPNVKHLTSKVTTLRLDGETPPPGSSSAVDIPSEAPDPDAGLCPVCFEDISELDETAQETHIDDCLNGAGFSKSPDRKRQSNRMLVFNMPAIQSVKNTSCSIDTVVDSLEPPTSSSASTDIGLDSTMKSDLEKKPLVDDNECLICLDILEEGEKVGRLECLCVFHYDCITSWFESQGGEHECPVHRLHEY